MTSRSDRGVVLVLVLLSMTLLAAVGVGLALSSSTSRLSATNHDEAGMLLNAAESALQLAARELALADTNGVLRGAETSALVDGAPGVRAVAPGTSVDLVMLTNQLTCGRTSACTPGQVSQPTSDRPWGGNNPRWQLFLHQPLAPPAFPGPQVVPYVVVWIGDDAREGDGDPAADGAGSGQEGRYIVRARAEAFGPRGGRRAIEAELVKVCTTGPAGELCAPGTRVQSWRAVTVP